MRRKQNVFRRYLLRKDFFRKVNQKFNGQVRKYSKNPFDDQRRMLRGVVDRPIIFDLGANVGDVTKKYARIFPQATIYSFEPFPEAFSDLLISIEHLTNVRPQQYAVSNEVGEKNGFVSQYDAMNSLLPPSDLAWGFENKRSCVVQTTTLDAFCAEQQIPEIHILKMDIQGGESMALEGSRNLLQSEKIWLIYTELLIEPLYVGQASMLELMQFLADCGFSLFNLYNFREAGSLQLRWCDGLFVGPQTRKWLSGTTL